MNDVLTQPWFIILLGAILAIMMLSFGAMVFVKRKHMMMKQSALNTMRGEYVGQAGRGEKGGAASLSVLALAASGIAGS